MIVTLKTDVVAVKPEAKAAYEAGQKDIDNPQSSDLADKQTRLPAGSDSRLHDLPITSTHLRYLTRYYRVGRFMVVGVLAKVRASKARLVGPSGCAVMDVSSLELL